MRLHPDDVTTTDEISPSSLTQILDEIPDTGGDAFSTLTVSVLDSEPKWKRVLFLLVALAITWGVGFFLFSFLAPAPGRPGIDENAYLVGGKNLAQHLTTGFKTSDDYQFVGAMWLRTKAGWYYPKYPFGLPLLNALAVLVRHREWAFAISPISTCLAVLGMFFLARGIVGSFYALLAMLVLAMGPTTLQLADQPNSHAPALCVVVWGMFFLLRWWQSGRWQPGVLAGLLLGFAVTIRYTEALLLFPLYSLDVIRADQYIGPKLLAVLKCFGVLPVGPLGIAVLSRVKWKSWRSYLSAGIPIFAWAVPVGMLVLFNWFTIGHFTGYDSTNESTGFSLDYFFNKWDFSLYQVYLFGLFFLLPLGVAGLILMFRNARRTALLLTLWFLPGTLLYTAYYWGANMPSIGYLRFFLTLYPPLIIAAMWMLRSTGQAEKGSIVSPLAAGLLTAVAVSIGLSNSLMELNRQHRGNLNLQYSAHRIVAHIKSAPGGKPMILTDTGNFPQLLQYMQFMVDADWYASDIFSPRVGGGIGLAGLIQQPGKDANSPIQVQTERIEYIDAFRKGKTEADFIRDERHLMDEALTAGRKIYAVLLPTESALFRQRYVSNQFEMIELEHWSEPCAVPNPETHWLTLPAMTTNVFIPWDPQRRTMYEIRRLPPKSSTQSPATKPASAPSR